MLKTLSLEDALRQFKAIFEDINRELATNIWLHKEFKEQLSLDDFLKKNSSRSFGRSRIKPLSRKEEVEAINFSNQFIKIKEGSD